MGLFSKRRVKGHRDGDGLTDLDLRGSGAVYDEERDVLQYYWFHTLEWEDGQEYDLWRVVQLRVLRYLPQETRQEPGLVDRMRTVLTGLYDRRQGEYDLVEMKAGIFGDVDQGKLNLGVVQMYGAVGIGATYEEAKRSAGLGLAGVQAAMSNFPQARLKPLSSDLAKWVREALRSFPNASVVIGQPEPRRGPRGMGREGPGEMGQQDDGTLALTQQQGEMFCRAMAERQEEFLTITLASRLAQADLSRMLVGAAQEASVPASQVSGSESISAGIAIPFSLSTQLAQNVATAFGSQQGESVSDGVSDSETISHTEGRATSHGYAVTDGVAHTEGFATSSGSSESHSTSVSEGHAHTEGEAHTEGKAHTVGRAHTSGGSSSSSFSVTNVPSISTTTVGSSASQSSGWSAGSSHGLSQAEGTGWSESQSEGTSSSESGNWSAGAQASVGLHESVSGGIDVRPQVGGTQVGGIQAGGSIGASQSVGVSAGVGGGTSTGESASSTSGQSGSSTTSRSAGVSSGVSGGASQGVSRSVSTTPGHSITSSSTSYGSFSSSTKSVSNTTSESDTTSQADTESHSTGHSTGHSTFHSTTRSVADTVSHAETESWASTRSVSDGVAHGQSRSHGVSRSSGQSIGRSLGRSLGRGVGVGLMPSFSLSRSYQWFNDPAAQLTMILRAQEELLRQATLDGAYLTDLYVLTRSEAGAATAEVALRQAYQGSGELVVTPVQSRRLTKEDQRYIASHALAFTPSTREERIAGTLEAYRDSTLLLPLQLAAYMAPALFEEGYSVTTQERIPTFAYVPDMPGEAVLGHQYSTERADLTGVPLRMSEDRFFHTVFAADTGYGKTVAAERLVFETTEQWHYRTVVLDFGAGWRRLLNAPWTAENRVEVWQLFPGAQRPFRWNPWQVGRRIQPERQMVATCEIFKNAGRMGARQLGLMRRAARELYLDNGVLTADKEIATDPVWGRVRDSKEEAVINVERRRQSMSRRKVVGLHMSELEPFERQALAVHRSKAVDMSAWVERLRSYMPELEGKGDRATMQSLEGVLLRLEVFTQGEIARMYGSGEDTVAIEDLGLLGSPEDPWGVSVLEGGAEMDEYAKISILGLVAWHLYNDAVVRRREAIGKEAGPVLQIVFEEANKVLTGTDAGGDDQQSGAASTSTLFQAMWRDGRKYRIFLHPIVQTVSELPPGVLSSCNNAFFSQTKNPDDRDLMMAHLAFSEKGFTDEDYKRFISRMPVGMAVAKLGYSMDVMHTTPFLVRPSLVFGEEPTDAEVYQAMTAAVAEEGISKE